MAELRIHFTEGLGANQTASGQMQWMHEQHSALDILIDACGASNTHLISKGDCPFLTDNPHSQIPQSNESAYLRLTIKRLLCLISCGGVT